MVPVPNIVRLGLLIQSIMCFIQEGCMKPGDKLLAVNGESVLGYTVEKVESLEIGWTHYLLLSLTTRI